MKDIDFSKIALVRLESCVNQNEVKVEIMQMDLTQEESIEHCKICERKSVSLVKCKG